MLNVKGNSSSGDMVAKPVPRKRGRPPANTASSVEKRKRQKKNNQSTNNKNDCVSKSELGALVSYANNIKNTNCISNSKKQNNRILTNVNYKPVLDSTIKAANNSHNEKPIVMETPSKPNTVQIDKLICDDISRPYAYINAVKKASTVTVDDIKATKNYDFFEVISLDRVLPLLCSQEYINILKWDDKFGKACAYDAKEISTTAWRHFRLSWHDYMNTVISTSPFRRDHLILEKIKKLGPPRSINGIRRTFSLGDARSRRMFFQIFYAPRISQKSGIELPETLVLMERNQQQQSVPVLSKNALPTLQMRNVVPVPPSMDNSFTNTEPRQNIVDARSHHNYNLIHRLIRGYNMNASRGLQPPSLGMDINNSTRTSMLNVNVAPINIFPNPCLPNTGLMHPSLYRNSVVGKPVITARANGNGVVTEATGYPMAYAINAAPTLASYMRENNIMSGIGGITSDRKEKTTVLVPMNTMEKIIDNPADLE